MARDRPQVLSGFRDILPEQMIARQHVLDTARRVFESYGFLPLDTPSLEYASVLMGKMGPEAEGLFYNFEDRGNRHVALRYDLTVPLARFMASHPELSRPFKRYQVGTVWRQERPQKGRYREFTQCDADIVGAPAGAADAEIIAILSGIYRELGLLDSSIRINHRQVLNALARRAGVPPELLGAALRGIDKLDKVSPDEVLDVMETGGISKESGRSFLDLIRVETSFRDSRDLLDVVSEDESGVRAAHEMIELGRMLDSMGLPAESYRIDLSLARGLDYYTGIIFEAGVPDFRSSIGSGGRYDSLVGIFAGQDLPTVGGSIGLDRVIDVLADRGMLPVGRAGSGVLITVFSPELRSQSLAIAGELRVGGAPVEVYLGDGTLRKQFAYADQKGLGLAVVVGPDELAAGTVAVRNMRSREQSSITRTAMCQHVGALLADLASGKTGVDPEAE